MNAITIIVIVIVVLLIGGLVFLLIRKNKENPEIIYGGEGMPVSYGQGSNSGQINMTFSEMVLEEKRKYLDKITIKNEEIEDIFKNSIRKYSSLGLVKYRNEDGFINQNMFPRYFSDALLDGLLISRKSGIENVICKNEFPSKNTFNMNKDEINNGFVGYSTSNTSFLIKNESGSITIRQNNTLEKLKDKNIYIFIEFSYPSSLHRKEFIKGYELIHQKTSEIINSIINCSTKQLEDAQIYLIRIEFKNIESKFSLSKFTVGENVAILKNNWDEVEYMKLVIPPTTESFDMDEFLIAQTSDTNYLIQVEHSEGNGNHKSNMVEFILRTCRYLKISVDDTFTIVNRGARIQTNDFVYGYYLDKYQSNPKKKAELEKYDKGIKYIPDGEKLFVKKKGDVDISKNDTVFYDAYPGFYEKYIKQNSYLYGDFVSKL